MVDFTISLSVLTLITFLFQIQAYSQSRHKVSSAWTAFSAGATT